jgi:hypothetical protein
MSHTVDIFKPAPQMLPEDEGHAFDAELKRTAQKTLKVQRLPFLETHDTFDKAWLHYVRITPKDYAKLSESSEASNSLYFGDLHAKSCPCGIKPHPCDFVENGTVYKILRRGNKYYAIYHHSYDNTPMAPAKLTLSYTGESILLP